jgi:hypothetical protein
MPTSPEVDEVFRLANALSIDLTDVSVQQGEYLMVGSGGGAAEVSTPMTEASDAASGLPSARRVFASSRPDVGLFVFDEQAGAKAPCGGPIGGASGHRFCCIAESRCSVASHQQRRFAATAGHAYIMCPGRVPSAYCSPSLNLEEIALSIRDQIELGQGDYADKARGDVGLRVRASHTQQG